jgi:hypothetical protein
MRDLQAGPAQILGFHANLLLDARSKNSSSREKQDPGDRPATTKSIKGRSCGVPYRPFASRMFAPASCLHSPAGAEMAADGGYRAAYNANQWIASVSFAAFRIPVLA